MFAIVKNIIGKARYDSWYFGRHYHRLLQRDGCDCGQAEGEEAYLNRWRRLSRQVEPYSYRYYSRFCGPTADIVPEYILHNQIEPCINPLALWDEYEDKNRFALYLGDGCLPATVLCRMKGGEISDVCRRPLVGTVEAALADCHYTSLILKPAMGSSCGDRIMKFDRVGDGYRDAAGQMLDKAFLLGYGTDWILQECIVPHPFMQQFCSTAVSTLRLAVYRSVVDGQSTVTGAVLRVGPEGAVVDNTSAGGCYVGVELASGELHRTFFDVQGKRRSVWNGVDLNRQTFTVPHWQEVLALAHRVAASITDHHLLALDIALNEKGKPVVLEYNIGGFSAFLFHHVGQPPLADHVDEVIDFCLRKR